MIHQQGAQLTYLNPIDIVKLDRSMTNSITGEKGRKIVKALIRAWHKMSVKCLAEGVEDTIKNVGRLGRVGMRDTDREIMKIMTGN